MALVLVEDFHIPDVFRKYNTAEKKQSRRLLECLENNFLTQMVGEPKRTGTHRTFFWEQRWPGG